MHENHRVRLKKRFLTEGIDSFEPHNILELLLFFTIPQKDTNEIAHALINKFGSISKVFDAEFEELLEIKYIGIHTATLLKMIPSISRYYSIDKLVNYSIMDTVDKIGKYLVESYIGTTREIVKLILLDNKYSLIECVKVHEGSVNSAYVSIRRLAEIGLTKKASMVVLAHNHPDGSATPSIEDIDVTKSLAFALGVLEIPLIEHIIVSGDVFLPILKYCKNEDYINDKKI